MQIIQTLPKDIQLQTKKMMEKKSGKGDFKFLSSFQH
jgi:hypothetical protein